MSAVMKSVTVTLLFLIVISSLHYPALVQSFEFNSFLSAGLGKIIGDSFDNGQTDFMGYDCQYSVRPKFRKWKLYYRAKFSCPGLAPFTGTETSSGKAKAINLATKKFAQRALDAKLFDRSQLALWL